MRRLLLLVAMPALMAVVLASACGGSEPQSGGVPADEPPVGIGGAARSFLMGVSSQPVRATEQAYRDAFDVAQQAGEIVLIQRTPPWSEFVPGGSISSRTEQLTRLEKELAEEHELRLFLAVDPTVPGDRSELANLPEELAGEGFANEAIRAAFVAYAKYLALNYKPAYMALGVEVDMIYRSSGTAAFDDFISLYVEAYEGVKSVSPDTLVFPTFQYEDMLGLLDTGSPTLPSWELVNRFEPEIDLLSVTSYPGLVFDSVAELPDDYYASLDGRINRSVMFASVGWHSSEDLVPEDTEAPQVTYLQQVLSAADELDVRVLIWYLGRDPEAVPAGFELLARMGLHEADGRPKRAWGTWRSVLDRPVPLP